MILKIRSCVFAFVGFGCFTLLLCELALRIWVPLHSIVDVNNLAPIAWYLDNADSLESRKAPSIHISDKQLGWTYVKNLRQPRLSTNSQGLRGKREYAQQRQPNRLRGVILGDSFSAGYGVDDNETFAAQLESIVSNSEFPNLAVPGYGVDQAILRWEKIGRALSPDLVILGIFLPDFHRITLPQWFDAPKPRFEVVNGELYLPEQPLPLIEDVSANRERIRLELTNLLHQPRISVATKHVFQRVAGKISGWREASGTFDEKSLLLQLLITRLATDCEERGVRLVIVNILTEYSEYPDERRILDAINAAAYRNYVPVLTLDRSLGVPESELSLNPVFDVETGHWSAYGHKRAAQSIARFLLQKKVVSAGESGAKI